MTQDLETTQKSRSERKVPGDSLLVAHELWLSGRTSSDAHGEAARSLGIPPADLQAIRDFHRKVVTRSKDEPLVLCRGVSCRMHGAEDFHAALKSSLDSAGVLGATLDVLCLSQCPHGPNVKVQESILCTGRGTVIADDRPWRPDTAGPRPIDTPSPASG